MAGAATIVVATLGLAGEPQNPNKPADAAGIFKSRCATCHGADGAGTTLGNSMQIPDLRSAKVQRRPDSVLSQVIREGSKNMPSFQRSLDSAQIVAVVGFIRGFRLSGKTHAAKSLSTSVFGKARVNRNPAQEQRDWSVNGGANENNHYSVLAQINRSNVKQLAVAWSFDSREEGGLQTSPIVVEGVIP